VAAALHSSVADALAGRATVVVVDGAAGVGKTTLLTDVERRARDDGAAVLVTRGTAVDAEIGFAGLLTFLRPVEGRLDELAGDGAGALRAALTLGADSSPDAAVAIGLGVYRVLTALADEGPVLVLVDDAHLLDRATADALGFALGRLGVDPIAAVLTSDGSLAPPLASAVRETVVLTGLDEPVLAVVVRAEGVVDEEAVRWCHRFADGNPLVAVQLARTLDDAQRRGRAPLPDVPRAPDAIARGFVHQLDGVAAPVRRAMVVVAADDTGDPGVLRRALERLGEPPDALDDAERAGLVRRDGGQVRLAHPLLRAVAYHQVAPASRRAAHAALARALDRPEQAVARAWQLAAAADGPDEDAAAALVLVAGDLARRGGSASAARVLERAATLTPDDAARGERHVAAAEWWVAAGDLDGARQALEAGLEVGLGGGLAAVDRLVALQRVAVVVADPGPLLDRIARVAGHLGPGPEVATVRADLLVETGGPAAVADQLAGLPVTVPDGTADDDGPPPPVRMLAGLVRARAGQSPPPAVTAAPPGTDRPAAVPVGAAVPRSRIAELVALRLAQVAVERGEPWLDPPTTTPPGTEPERRAIRSRARWHGGDLMGASHDLRDALAVLPAVATGLRAPLLAALAEVDHLRGRPEDAAVHLDEATLDPGGWVPAEVIAARGWVEGRAALDRGEAAVAVDLLAMVARLRPVRVAGELAVALVAAERRDEAGRWVRDLMALSDPGPMGEVAREVAAGIVRDDPARLARAGEAATTAGLVVVALEAGLTRSEALARVGDAGAARDLARRVEREAATLGIRCWSGRLGRLQRPTGPTSPPAAALLTAAEHRVAAAVASGGTNREVAAELFLSVKTVDFHLQNIYRKLGVRSRTELAVRMSREREGSGGRP
jgi:DNA-binding CsgD family transcriptional regulator